MTCRNASNQLCSLQFSVFLRSPFPQGNEAGSKRATERHQTGPTAYLHRWEILPSLKSAGVIVYLQG